MLAVRARLLTFLSALSLLLCVASAVLWVRSHIISDQFWSGRVDDRPDGQDDVSVYMLCDWGGLCILRTGHHYPQDFLKAHPNNRSPAGPYKGRRSWGASAVYPYQGGRPGAPVAFRFAGFELTTGLRPNPKDPFRRHTAAMVVPIWALTLLTALPPAVFLVRRLRRRPLPAGARPCPRCNYDLRATPDRCPECGTPAGPKNAPASNPGI